MLFVNIVAGVFLAELAMMGVRYGLHCYTERRLQREVIVRLEAIRAIPGAEDGHQPDSYGARKFGAN